jgi:predicted subunit of tRNA(5-methylaminomethyl-2-thiouridylate) methyltransferase
MKQQRYGLPSQNEQISASGQEQCATIELQRRLLYTQMATLVEEQNPQRGIDGTLKEMIESWAQAEVDQVAGTQASTPLEKLLKRHHDLGEDLLDVVAENLPYD